MGAQHQAQLLWQCQSDVAPTATHPDNPGRDTPVPGGAEGLAHPRAGCNDPLRITEPQGRSIAHVTISRFLKDHTHSRPSSSRWDGIVQLPGHSLEAPKQPWNSSAPTALKERQAGAKNQTKAGRELGRRFLQPSAASVRLLQP